MIPPNKEWLLPSRQCGAQTRSQSHMLEHSLLPRERVLGGQSQLHTCRCPFLLDDALGPNARKRAKPVLKTLETGGFLRHPWSAADR